jgi:hypothetical protein
MKMETLIVVVIAAVVGWVVWKMIKKPDVNNDGVVDVKDVVAAAKEVAVEAKAEAKEVAVKAAAKVKKARAKKAK